MFPNQQPPKMRTMFRGVAVWAGIAMAAVGMIALECGADNTGFTTMIFLGAFQAGMGAMANAWAHSMAQQPGQRPPRNR